ncbi:MAG TPA: hypothetical protein VFI47_23555 [Acidimicrobiales bacterium]|nr:hypothetical protein [Acidimicrobiales bacterium]
MSIRRAAVAATTGLVVSALLAGAPVGAQSAPLPLNVSPTSGPVGTVVDISGSGCLGPEGPGAVLVFALFQGEELPPVDADPANPVIANADGTWEFPVEILPEAAEAGSFDIAARCTVNDASGTVIAEYARVPFTITDGTPTTEPPAPADPAPAPAAAPVTATPTFTG